MSTLDIAVQFTLLAEGGFTVDDGGPTNYGVTQNVYDTYRSQQFSPLQSVQLITLPEVTAIMSHLFWTPSHCDDLCDPVAVAHFDWAYNHGCTGAIETIQTALGVSPDGNFGALTKSAADAAGRNVLPIYLNLRRMWYRNAAIRDRVKYAAYLTGWLNRVNRLESYINQTYPV